MFIFLALCMKTRKFETVSNSGLTKLPLNLIAIWPYKKYQKISHPATAADGIISS